ncbi:MULTISPECIES: tRNA(fMet)-specific endonuclease VapC [unclassified Polynucleobacter]|uniref:type II toxin-antitoxin system tRNA(fMet)-specific endonuclease VapC n=1 Tax=unclassified Polynucleobacter TaxID=2640945 RepID=UPI00249393CB|nr:MULTISPECIES: tRNA(fMet)-specific endonuclease VapC [unclassified Polynucleobacter]
MLKYMLDTNIVIYVLKRRPIQVLDIFNQNTNRMAISSITLSELIYGAEKSQNISKNLDAIEDFISHIEVLSYDQKTSQTYGQIKAKLEKNGEIIGENDIHIAAHAISQGLILVTNNLYEFRRVPHLSLENWV